MIACRLLIKMLLFALAVSSCATTDNETAEYSRLDSSGLTVVALPESTVLSHALPTVAAGARDYVYIGPVEINNMGSRDYYLWISLASTIDREFVRLPTENATELVLLVDDEPMQFNVVHWQTELDAPPYASAAPVYATLEAATTIDQIHRIATARNVEVHLVAEANSDARYQFWSGNLQSWQAFTENRR